MVADRKVSPVGHQRVLLTAEHDADVGSVLLGGVKIGVVPNVGGQMGLDSRDGEDGTLKEVIVVPESGLAGREELLDVEARGGPDGLAQGHEQVQGGLFFGN